MQWDKKKEIETARVNRIPNFCESTLSAFVIVSKQLKKDKNFSLMWLSSKNRICCEVVLLKS